MNNKETHTYRAVRVSTQHPIEAELKKEHTIKSLEDPLDKGRCDFDKSVVVETHSFGGIKIEFLEQTQNTVL